MVGLFVISIIVGLSFIWAGSICKNNPTMIAGYNRIDENQKKTFPDFLKKVLSITGIIMIASCCVAFLFKWATGIIIFMALPGLIMPIYILLKENSSKQSLSGILIVFLVLLTIAIPCSIFISSTEPTILIEQEQIKISGLYGETILFQEIKDVELANTIPAIQLRTNGLALGSTCKGYFLMEGMGMVKLFLNSSAGPYVKIHAVSNRNIIFNFEDSVKTTDTYNKIKESL